jgi:hypothetical protein
VNEGEENDDSDSSDDSVNAAMMKTRQLTEEGRLE